MSIESAVLSHFHVFKRFTEASKVLSHRVFHKTNSNNNSIKLFSPPYMSIVFPTIVERYSLRLVAFDGSAVVATEWANWHHKNFNTKPFKIAVSNSKSYQSQPIASVASYSLGWCWAAPVASSRVAADRRLAARAWSRPGSAAAAVLRPWPVHPESSAARESSVYKWITCIDTITILRWRTSACASVVASSGSQDVGSAASVCADRSSSQGT